VQLRGVIEDSQGTAITDFSFERTVAGVATFLELMGLPAELAPDAPPHVRDRLLRENLADPHTTISGNRISAAPNSPYAIELLLNNRQPEPRLIDGLAFADVGLNDVYAVRLINDSPLDAAVSLKIDGLSVFAFSDLRYNSGPRRGEPSYSVIILPPKSHYDVRGWHRTNNHSDSFVVTEYAKSAAASLNHHANVGTITAIFSAAWSATTPPPADEPPRKKGLPNATGFGPRVAANFAEVQRSIGAVRASVSVRYAK
jgi:hypothetical protein